MLDLEGLNQEQVEALIEVAERLPIELARCRILAVDTWLRFIVQKELDDLSPAEARRLILKRAALLPS
jgi:hypothetical protein